jgi:hypothetical protein
LRSRNGCEATAGLSIAPTYYLERSVSSASRWFCPKNVLAATQGISIYVDSRLNLAPPKKSKINIDFIRERYDNARTSEREPLSEPQPKPKENPRTTL